MVVPSLTPAPADKIALRRLARERRGSFVKSLGPKQRAAAEKQLARVISPLLARGRIVGGYCPLPMEISPLDALEEAAAGGRIVAYPAFADRHADFRFLAGDPTETGPFACLQPGLDAPEVHPDIVLVPLVAIDSEGTRLGQGKGHYDRVLGRLRRDGALLIGLGWAIQKVEGKIPADPWDIPLDGFASEERLEMFR